MWIRTASKLSTSLLCDSVNSHNKCTVYSGMNTEHTRFVQIVSGLELWWLFTGWDVFATSLDMSVHVLATHDTSCKWLRLHSWL